ncbi:hypothetical protein B0B52_21435 [Polaromonas sp. A23]|nr:hypothetical protein B0B52_21435 [Polaromonas sp. A23]
MEDPGFRKDMTPTLPTSCGSLPPEGAAAPAARQSRFRGPCWSIPHLGQRLFLGHWAAPQGPR